MGFHLLEWLCIGYVIQTEVAFRLVGQMFLNTWDSFRFLSSFNLSNYTPILWAICFGKFNLKFSISEWKLCRKLYFMKISIYNKVIDRIINFRKRKLKSNSRPMICKHISNVNLQFSHDARRSPSWGTREA